MQFSYGKIWRSQNATNQPQSTEELTGRPAVALTK